MDDHAPTAWRQVGSHVAVQEARGDGHGRRSRHSVAAAMLAVAGAAAVLATLRVGTQGGQELAQLPPAKGRPEAIRVPGIRSAKQLLAEAAAAAKAKKQTLAVQIPGIRPQTQDIINSGAWDPKAIEDDMTDGLLPNLNQDGPHVIGDDDKKTQPPPVVDHPYVPPPPGEPNPPPPLGQPAAAPGGGPAAPGEEGPAAPGGSTPDGSAPAGVTAAPPGQAGAAPEDAKDATKEGSAPGAPGTAAQQPHTPYDFEDGVDFQVQGHCTMSPTTACTKDEECSVTGGGCVFWHCTSDPDLRCASTADCASSGGICTGPGHCSGDPSLACATDRECTESGGSCVLGGYCSGVPSRSCMSDSDCGDSGGTCRTKNKVWWEEDENFPKDPKFGPYATWSRLQFHKKLLVLLLKILHLQNDLESQVPINGQFLGQITWLKQFLASSSLELGDAAQGASDQGNAQVADVTIKLDTDTKKLASDMMGLDSELHGIDATQDQRLADMETDGPFRQKMEGMTGDAYQRSSKLVSDQSALDAFWKSPAGSPSGMRPELTGMVDRSITETRGNIADGISRYTGFATTRYQTGYRHLDQLYRNFKFLTESNLRGAQRHMGRINATIAEREESVGDALDRIEEDGHLETGTVANETATVEELVQDILSHAEDLVTNTSASLEEAKLWKEAREAAAAAKEAAAAAAAASGTEPCDGPTKCHPENKFCVGYEEDTGFVYCYGLDSGCKWNENDCATDADCSKYTTSSPKYTDSTTCPGSEGWRAAACTCPAGTTEGENGPDASPEPLSDSQKIEHLRNAVDEITGFLKKLFPDGKLPAAPKNSGSTSDESGSDGGDGGSGTECCATQCTGLPAPLTNTQVDTDATDRGTGATHFLDRQDVDCGGSPMSGFHLRTVEEMSKLTYRIKCSAGADLDVHEEKDSSIEEDGNGNLIFLDRLNVDCGTNGAISEFKLVRDGESDPKTEAHYAYKCVTSDLADTMIDCEDLSTPLNDGPEGDKVEFLDRHVVQCPVNKVLQQFQLRHNEGKINYEYRCCAVSEQRKVGAKPCDCGSCPTGVINSELVDYAPKEFYCGGSGATVSSCDECQADCFSPMSVLTNRDPADKVYWNPITHVPETDDISITLDAGKGGKTVKAVLWANMGDTTHDPVTLKVESAEDPTGPWSDDAILDVKDLQGSSERTAIALPKPVTARYFKLSPGGIVWQSIARIIALCSTDDCEPPVDDSRSAGGGPPAGPKPAELLLNMYCKQYLDEAARKSSKMQKRLDKCRPQDCAQAKEGVGCHYMNPNGFCWTDPGQHWCAENKDSPWCLTEVSDPAYEKCEGQGVVAAWEAAATKVVAAKSSVSLKGRSGGRGRMGFTAASRTAHGGNRGTVTSENAAAHNKAAQRFAAIRHDEKRVDAAAARRAKAAADAAARAISRGKDFKQIQSDTDTAIASAEKVLGQEGKPASKDAIKDKARRNGKRGQVPSGKKRKAGARQKSWKSMFEFLE